MSERGERLRTAPAGQAKFLRDKELALSEHWKCLVRWLRALFAFGKDEAGCTFGGRLGLHLAEMGRRMGIKPTTTEQGRDGEVGVPKVVLCARWEEPPCGMGATCTYPRSSIRVLHAAALSPQGAMSLPWLSVGE